MNLEKNIKKRARAYMRNETIVILLRIVLTATCELNSE